ICSPSTSATTTQSASPQSTGSSADRKNKRRHLERSGSNERSIAPRAVGAGATDPGTSRTKKRLDRPFSARRGGNQSGSITLRQLTRHGATDVLLHELRHLPLTPSIPVHVRFLHWEEESTCRQFLGKKTPPKVKEHDNELPDIYSAEAGASDAGAVGARGP